MSLCCLFVSLSGLAYPTIQLYLSAVRFLQISTGMTDPFTVASPMLTYVLRGVRRTHPLHTRPKRLPITPDILHLLHRSWSSIPLSYDHCMLSAASCLAFFGFLRCGEFTTSPGRHSTCLTIEDNSFDTHPNPTVVTFVLRHTKTDRLGQGVSISLSRIFHSLCPVTALLSYLALRPAIPGPLFIFPNGSPLSRSHVVSSVRQALLSQGMDTSQYSGHSFRIGTATAAAKAGLGNAIIKQLGRWKSSAYSTYIHPPCQSLIQARARLSST